MITENKTIFYKKKIRQTKWILNFNVQQHDFFVCGEFLFTVFEALKTELDD